MIFREDWKEEHDPDYVTNRLFREVQGPNAFIAFDEEVGGVISGLTWGQELPLVHLATALKAQKVHFASPQVLSDELLRKVVGELAGIGSTNVLLWSEILIEPSHRGTNLLNDLVRAGALVGSWNIPVVMWTDKGKSSMYPIAVRYWRAKELAVDGDLVVLLIHPTWPMKLAYTIGQERLLFKLMRKIRRRR